MDERLKILFARRSIRDFTGEPISAADLRSLLEAGMAAPSGSNRQPWHFVVVTDHATLNALADAHPYAQALRKAAVGIAVCGDPEISKWWVQDCSAATENILIAAAGLGLGGVWHGSHGAPERETAIRQVLGIPEQIGVLSLLAIGHPAPGAEKEPRTQYNLEKIHTGKW